jgi:RNA polymerase sigma-70 factor (ECF subfamily)
MRMLERWVTEYQPVVFRAACLILRDEAAAEDVAQETFIRAYRAAPKLQPGAEIRAWLYRISTNLALNHLRSRRREASAFARVGAGPVVSDDPAEAGAVRSAVSEALGRLPDRLRVPVILRYYLDLSEQDIARTLGIRPGTVKSRLHDARRTLGADEAMAAASS